MVLGVFGDLQAQRRKKKSALKMAKAHLQYEEYQQAIPHIQELLNREDQSPEYNYWMGKSLFLTYQKKKALPFLDKTHDLNPAIDKDFYYIYGMALHYNNRLDDAISAYRKDQSQFEPDDPRHRVLSNRISQASYAKRFKEKKDSKLVDISNMGESINTKYAEHSPVISADNTLLMFTARRPDSKGADPEKFYYDEDIYLAKKQGDGWSPAENIGNPVNSKGHDATISLTADAQTLYLYRHKKAGGLYKTDFDAEGEKWKEPKAIEKPLNSKYYEASICQSADSSKLFFSSDRPGGYGGLDIYILEREGKEWGEPQNLGPRINTPFNEDAPFIHPDGLTLYFSSDGNTSIGGYDIFVTEFDESGDAWLDPLNMGPPINSADDEIYFVISQDGLNGYFASGREGGFGEKDIYQAKFPYFRYPKRYYAMEIAGMVQDINSLDTLPAVLKLIDKETGEVVGEVNTELESGTYTFEVEPERSYSLEVETDGYDIVLEEFTTPERRDEDVVIERNILVYRPVAKEIPKVESSPMMPVVQHIYFDFDKDQLRNPAKQELESVADILLKNNNLNVEISGHTDWYGSFDYNVDLSQRRSSSAYSYLVSRGVSANRIFKKDFSENQPIEENEMDEGRQYNRRVSFRFEKGDGQIAFASTKLKTGGSAPRIDHTTPRGEPGFDAPGATGAASSNITNADGPSYASETNPTNPSSVPKTDPETNTNTVLDKGSTVEALASFSLKHIYFDFDKSGLRSNSRNQLNRIVALLQENPSFILQVKGHTDAFGSVSYNQKLSESRSMAAFSFLQNNGVSLNQLAVMGFSELQPLASNDGASGRQSNRRVEFEIRDGSGILMRSSP